MLLGCGELAHMTHSTFQHVSPDGSLNSIIPFPQKLPIYQHRVQVSDRRCCVTAPTCFRFAVRPSVQRDFDIQLRHTRFRFAARD